MYKLMIVDDEQIEREGMAQFIPWEKYDIEICGTAWNGVDALEKIQQCEPDIVLTDIKMPVMNGIELISRLHRTNRNIVIVVLSGYGEYEFTSQAMEYGVRHYILKPCDEEKIVSVIDAAKREVEQKKEYYTLKTEIMVHAKEEVLRRMMTENQLSDKEFTLLKQDIPNAAEPVKLLGMRNKIIGFDYLEQFILGNVLGEILKMDRMPMFTAIDDTVYFVLGNIANETIKEAVQKTLEEFSRFRKAEIVSAVSLASDVSNLKELYEQIIYLFALGENAENVRFHCYPESNESETSNSYFAIDNIRNASNYDTILFEVTLAIKKMQSKELAFARKQKICQAMLMTWKNFLGVNDTAVPDLFLAESDNQMIEMMSIWFAETMDLKKGDKESERMQTILTIIYTDLDNTELNIRYVAKNKLFMNEDYFGRVFVKTMNVKFSAYLEECRIEMAKRLMEFSPEMKIAVLTELIGYPADGQYFSKIFRKICGKTPTEYREMLKSQVQ